MRQHSMSARWSAEERPRLLLEDASPALQYADLACFREAGFDVSVCSGPEELGQECPLVRGEECALAASADVVLFGPDRLFGHGRTVLDAFRQRYPETAKLIAVGRRGPEQRLAFAPAGCIPMAYPSSVGFQVDACRRALYR